MKKKRQGFTLIELLAVIVILAIILAITIPYVLEATNAAKKESFFLYAQSLQSKAIAQYTQDLEHNKELTDCAVYDINKDLHLSDTGKYQGWIQVLREKVSSGKRQVTVNLEDSRGLEYVKYCVAKGTSCTPTDTYQIAENSKKATISQTVSDGYVLCAKYQYVASGKLQNGGTKCQTYSQGIAINDSYNYKVTVSLIDDSYAANRVLINKDMSMEKFYAQMNTENTLGNNITIVEPICGTGVAQTITRGEKNKGTVLVTAPGETEILTSIVSKPGEKTTQVVTVTNPKSTTTKVQNVNSTTKTTTNVIVGTTTKTTTNVIVGTTTKTTTNVIVGTTTKTTKATQVGTTTKTTKATQVGTTTKTTKATQVGTTTKTTKNTKVTTSTKTTKNTQVGTTTKTTKATQVGTTTKTTKATQVGTTTKTTTNVVVGTTTKTTTNVVVGTTTKTTTNQIVGTTTTTQRTTILPTTTIDVKDTSLLLFNLEVVGYDIGFNQFKFYYDLDVPYTTTSLQINASGMSDVTQITVSGTSNLVVGRNTVIVQLYNTETGARSYYRIYVYRAEKPGSDVSRTTNDPYGDWDPESGLPDPTLEESSASLSLLAVAGYTLDFRPDVYEYTVEILDQDSVKLDYRTVGKNALVNITGNENLKDGSVIEIYVQSENGYYYKTYKINIAIKNQTSTTTKVLQGAAVGLAATAGIAAAAVHFVQKRKSVVVQDDKENNNNQGSE